MAEICYPYMLTLNGFVYRFENLKQVIHWLKDYRAMTDLKLNASLATVVCKVTELDGFLSIQR